VSFTHRELKLLWGVVPNVCAFPACPQPLIQDGAVIGEMAHVRGENQGSSRHEVEARDLVDHVDNRVLLCPTHHTLIDKRELEMDYPADLLFAWKTAHPNKSGGRLTEDDLRLVASQYELSGVLQTMIGSPGAIQAAGDVTITNDVTNPKPALRLVEAHGAPGEENFGSEAVLFLGAEPYGPLGNVSLEIWVEGRIADFSTSIVGSGPIVTRGQFTENLDALI
jgi:hypothetical protein